MDNKIRLLTDKVRLLAEKNLNEEDKRAKIDLFFQSKLFKNMPHIASMTIHYGMANVEQARYYSWQTASAASSTTVDDKCLLGRVITKNKFKGVCVDIRRFSRNRAWLTLDNGILQKMELPVSGVDKISAKFKKEEKCIEWAAAANTTWLARERTDRLTGIIEKLKLVHPEFHFIYLRNLLSGDDFHQLLLVEKGKTFLDEILSNGARPDDFTIVNSVCNWLYMCETFAPEDEHKPFMLGANIGDGPDYRLLGLRPEPNCVCVIRLAEGVIVTERFKGYSAINSLIESPGFGLITALDSAKRFLEERKEQMAIAMVSQSTRRALIDYALF